MKFSEMTYTRPDIDALLADCKALAAKAAVAPDGDALVAVYYEQSRAFADYTTASQLANIHYTCDTRDAYWKAEQDFFDANGPAVANAQVEISRAFLSNPHVDALTEHFGTTCVAGMKNAVLGMDDRTVELQKEFNALVSQYQQVYGGALVELDSAVFGYTSDRHALKETSLRIEPGTTVALVGATGAGKSTIAKLVARFYDVSSGQVRIDGVDVRQLADVQLRREVLMLTQEVFLFSASILENIRMGNPQASDEQVKAAAKAVGADAFIERLRDGYESQLGRGGITLSAGQRQLVSFARVFLANPRVLILDEATSSVDTRTEQRIQTAMDRLMEGRTSFVIAHRLSTIKDADLILVMRDGDIVEQGTHDQLLAAGGFYADLYNSQFEDVVE